jgi:hypothetical protein
MGKVCELHSQINASIASSQLPADYQDRLVAGIHAAFNSEYMQIIELEKQAPEDFWKEYQRVAREEELARLTEAFHNRRITINNIVHD